MGIVPRRVISVHKRRVRITNSIKIYKYFRFIPNSHFPSHSLSSQIPPKINNHSLTAIKIQPFTRIPSIFLLPLFDQIVAIVLLLTPKLQQLPLNSLSSLSLSRQYAGKHRKENCLLYIFCADLAAFEGIVAVMQIFVPFLILGSVLYRIHKGFRKFVLGGVVLMDCFSCLKHSALDYDLWSGVFLFGRFKAVYRILGLILLFGLGLNFLFSTHFYSGIIRFLRRLSGKSVNLRTGFCSKNGKFRLSKLWKSASFVPIIDTKVGLEKIQKLNCSSDLHGGTKSDDEKECEDEEIESDIAALRELLKAEKQKVEDISAELAMERAASATAAEEAMAMILRLQNEKSLVEMEWSQYRRLAEEKQIHDQQVIRSLQMLVWQHEFTASLSMETPCSRRSKSKSKEENNEDGEEYYEARSPFNGNILDALENVLYSSRDSVCFSNQ